MKGQVLLVDDEPRVLDGLRRALRGRFPLLTAESGPAGLELLTQSIATGDSIAVILSDMMMPGMSGADFLSRAHKLVPDAVLMILSGQADLASTIEAVNNAGLFRFLTKPCAASAVAGALDAGLRQYQLVRAEKELLEETLGGTVQVLTDVLTLASPQASRRTQRMRGVVDSIIAELGLQSDWRLPLAAMLSHVGCIAVPGSVLDKVDAGSQLTTAEARIMHDHPATGRRLLERIPRLDEVAAWVGAQVVDLNGARSVRPVAAAPNAAGRTDIAACVLPAVSAFLILVESGEAPRDAARALAVRRFDPLLVNAVLKAVKEVAPQGVRKNVLARHLHPGMVVDCDVRTLGGIMLMSYGEKITEVLAERVCNFAAMVGVVEPIKVIDYS